MGIRISRAVGKKFELPGKQAAKETRESVTPPVVPSAASRLWGKFRNLFGRGH
jgi:hypothetical protein